MGDLLGVRVRTRSNQLCTVWIVLFVPSFNFGGSVDSGKQLEFASQQKRTENELNGTGYSQTKAS